MFGWSFRSQKFDTYELHEDLNLVAERLIVSNFALLHRFYSYSVTYQSKLGLEGCANYLLICSSLDRRPHTHRTPAFFQSSTSP